MKKPKPSLARTPNSFSRQLKLADEFLLNIKPEDRIAIIHDTDPDGICSAVIIAKTVKKLGTPITIHIPLDKTQYGITSNMIKQLQKNKINKLITTDFSAEHDLKLLKQLEKQMNILIIDHHKLYNNDQSNKTILIKPQLISNIDPSTYCAAKLAYDLCSRVIKIDNLDWLAATASISDIATQPWKKWLQKVFKKYKVKIAKNLFDTKLGQAATIISSAEVYDINLTDKCYDVFYKAENPEDVLNSKLIKYKKTIDKEIQKHIKNFKNAKKYKDLYIYEMKTKHRIHSPLSTILGLKYPHRTIIIINKDHQISVSARRGDKTKPVNNLLENSIKGFKNSNAGGHIPAAGAGFPQKYLKTFKKRLICQESQ